MNDSPPAAAPDEQASADEIFARAASRAQGSGFAYAGSVTPAEAHRLAQLGAATLVDIRTRPELEFVGRIEGSHLVEWRAWGAIDPHPDFVEKVTAAFGDEQPLLFLCRSGVRSHNAATALAQAGHRHAYNILQGFEGDRDGHGRRNTVGGWRFAGLPWTQS